MAFSSLTDEDGSLVDLYALLEVPRDTDTAKLRRRIAQLYLEAQDNLDHRNFRRRFYYQELFEIFLPQAHSILLNEARRARYDAQLEQRQSATLNMTSATTKAPVAAPRQPQATPSAKTPAAARPSPGAPPPSIREAQQEQLQLQQELQDDLVASLIGDTAAQARAQEVIRTRPPTPEWARMDATRVEQRREARRGALIRQELVATGQRSGLAVGACVALPCIVLAPLLLRAFGIAGSAALFFYLAALVLIGVAAYSIAQVASRGARRRVVAELSQLSYEELLRRCGHK